MVIIAGAIMFGAMSLGSSTRSLGPKLVVALGMFCLAGGYVVGALMGTMGWKLCLGLTLIGIALAFGLVYCRCGGSSEKPMAEELASASDEATKAGYSTFPVEVDSRVMRLPSA